MPMHIFGHIETLYCDIKTLCLLHRELPMPIKPNDRSYPRHPWYQLPTHGTPWNATQMQMGTEIQNMRYNARKIYLKVADYLEIQRKYVCVIRFV